MSDKAKRATLAEIAAAVPFARADVEANRRGEIRAGQQQRVLAEINTSSCMGMIGLLIGFFVFCGRSQDSNAAASWIALLLVGSVFGVAMLLGTSMQRKQPPQVQVYHGKLDIAYRYTSRGGMYYVLQVEGGALYYPFYHPLVGLLTSRRGDEVIIYTTGSPRRLLSMEFVEPEELP